MVTEVTAVTAARVTAAGVTAARVTAARVTAARVTAARVTAARITAASDREERVESGWGWRNQRFLCKILLKSIDFESRGRSETAVEPKSFDF